MYLKTVSTLDEFIAWVNRSPLPASTKQDCIKILETLRWIKVNQEKLREFIDNKTQYLSELPLRDQATGVVRDHLGTSLHFNSYQWCQLINLSLDPTTITSPEDLKKLVQNRSAYALFDNSLYFINPDGRVALLLFNTENIGPLTEMFPTVKDRPQESSKKCSEFLSSLTTYVVQTPGERAVHDLLDIVTVFERTFTTLNETNNTLGLLSFIAKCNYDKDRGCLEARVEKAMLFAAQIAETNGSCSQLNDLLQICQILYFFELENDTPNFIMASDFFTPFYGQLVVYQEQEQILTEDLVFGAMEELLFYERPSDALLAAEKELKASNLQQWQTKWQVQEREHQAIIFQRLIKNTKTAIGRTGMIQYRFETQERADQFSQWLRSCKSLAAYEIDRCQTQKEQKGTEIEYVVRLKPLQLEVLTNKTSASPVATPSQETHVPAVASQSTSPGEREKNLFNKLDRAMNSCNIYEFNALLAKASAEAINQALVIKSSYLKMTPLHYAAEKQDSVAFQALLAKASAEAINQALVIKNFDNVTPLHIAACRQDSAAFQALLAKASAGAINQALVIKAFDNVTPLHIAACSQDSAAFQALLAKASAGAINQALVIKAFNNVTPLHYAAAKQDSAAFQALLAKASAEAINQALVIKDRHTMTPLHYAAEKQDSVAFQALLAKASVEAINQSLVIKNSNNVTPLSLAAKHQDSAAFQALLAKASAEAINMACYVKNKQGYCALHDVLQNQNYPAALTLINKASPDVIRQSLIIGSYEQTIDWVDAQLSSIHNSAELEVWVVLLLKISGRFDAWPSDKSFTDEATLSAEIDEIKETKDAYILQMAQKILSCRCIIKEARPHGPIQLKLGNDKTALLTDANLADIVKTHGLASWKEFYILKKHGAAHPDSGALGNSPYARFR